ncbi:hypothetical protein BDW59DRAFT_57308 [Aspergillus cavernicola]|uniref:Secreted protein n=1 Tax=Aspergillus cavernicola TaxID=176166 RepID=A0ABR4IKI6_9EURO
MLRRLTFPPASFGLFPSHPAATLTRPASCFQPVHDLISQSVLHLFILLISIRGRILDFLLHLSGFRFRVHLRVHWI